MTWMKLGNEYFNELMDTDFPPPLDDACQLTHTQGIAFVYSTESMDLSFPKKAVYRFASSSRADEAVAELVRSGAWESDGRRFRIILHGDVIRQSLGYQIKEREDARERKARQRAKGKGGPSGGGGAPTNVTPEVTRDVTGGLTPNAVSQSDKQSGNDKSEALSPVSEGSSSSSSSDVRPSSPISDSESEALWARFEESA